MLTDETSERPPAAPSGGRPPTARHRAAARLGALGRPGPWRRGRIIAALALLLGLILAGHAWIPDTAGLGSLTDTFLPWFGLGVVPLLAAALVRRSATAVVALLLPAVVWASLFGGLLADKSRAGSGDLTVVSHNVSADNPDPAGTARTLAATGADVLALEELTPQARTVYERDLAKAYPHHAVEGTVGIWSKLPLSGVAPVDTAMDAGPLGATKTAAEKLPSNRALHATVRTARGPVAVYVVHLGSVRLMPRGGFWTESRDRNATALARAVAAEKSPRLVLLGDLNGTTDDRALHGLTSQLSSAQTEAGQGFGFSYPAQVPVVRIDQILLRGVTADNSRVLPATGSDHRPVEAALSW